MNTKRYVSLETRKKMSDAKKGKIPNEETRKKMSASRLGFRHTEESKNKMSEANKGRSKSETHRKKMSQVNIGKHHSEETRKKMSDSHKGKSFSYEHRKNLSGEHSHRWKGGITLLSQQIRTCFLYRQWRSDIFLRDNFTCVWCGKYGDDLHADHIKEFSRIIEENKIITLEQAFVCSILWDLNNGRTLCKPCHKKRHLIN